VSNLHPCITTKKTLDQAFYLLIVKMWRPNKKGTSNGPNR
jgi:hypothetical protein